MAPHQAHNLLPDLNKLDLFLYLLYKLDSTGSVTLHVGIAAQDVSTLMRIGRPGSTSFGMFDSLSTVEIKLPIVLDMDREPFWYLFVGVFSE